MQDGSNLTLASSPMCWLDHRPCAAVDAFCDRMTAACDLARGVAGAMPDLQGTRAPQACRFGLTCTLQWQVRDGILSLTRDGLPLGSMQIHLQ